MDHHSQSREEEELTKQQEDELLGSEEPDLISQSQSLGSNARGVLSPSRDEGVTVDTNISDQNKMDISSEQVPAHSSTPKAKCVASKGTGVQSLTTTFGGQDVRYLDNPQEIAVHIGAGPGISKDKYMESIMHPEGQLQQNIFAGDSDTDVVVEEVIEEDIPESESDLKSVKPDITVDTVKTGEKKSILGVADDLIGQWNIMKNMSNTSIGDDIVANRWISGSYHLPSALPDETLDHHDPAVKKSFYLSKLTPNAANHQKFYDVKGNAAQIIPRAHQLVKAGDKVSSNAKDYGLCAYQYWDVSRNYTYKTKLIKQVAPDGSQYLMHSKDEPFPSSDEEIAFMYEGLAKIQTLKTYHVLKPADYPNPGLYVTEELDTEEVEESLQVNALLVENENGPTMPIPIPKMYEDRHTYEAILDVAQKCKEYEPDKRCENNFRRLSDMEYDDISNDGDVEMKEKSWGEQVEETMDVSHKAEQVPDDEIQEESDESDPDEEEYDSEEKDEDIEEDDVGGNPTNAATARKYTRKPFREILEEFKPDMDTDRPDKLELPKKRTSLTLMEGKDDIAEYVVRYADELRDKDIPVLSFAHIWGNNGPQVWGSRDLTTVIVFKPGMLCPFKNCPCADLPMTDEYLMYAHWRLFHIVSGASFAFCTKCWNFTNKYSDAKQHMCRCFKEEDKAYGWSSKLFTTKIKEKDSKGVPKLFYKKLKERFKMVWYPNLTASEIIKPEVVTYDGRHKGGMKKPIDTYSHICWIWLKPELKDPRLPLCSTRKTACPRPGSVDWELCHEKKYTSYEDMLVHGEQITDLSPSENKLKASNKKFVKKVPMKKVPYQPQPGGETLLTEQELLWNTKEDNMPKDGRSSRFAPPAAVVKEVAMMDVEQDEDSLDHEIQGHLSSDQGESSKEKEWQTKTRIKIKIEPPPRREKLVDLESEDVGGIPIEDIDPVPYPATIGYNEPQHFHDYIKRKSIKLGVSVERMAYKLFTELDIMIHYQFRIMAETTCPDTIVRIQKSIFRLRVDRQLVKVLYGLFPSTLEKQKRKAEKISFYFFEDLTRAHAANTMTSHDQKMPPTEGYPFRRYSNHGEYKDIKYFCHEVPGHHPNWNRRLTTKMKEEFLAWNQRTYDENHPHGLRSQEKAAEQAGWKSRSSSPSYEASKFQFKPVGRGRLIRPQSPERQVAATAKDFKEEKELRGRSPVRRTYDTRSNSRGSKTGEQQYRDRSGSVGRGRSNSSGRGRRGRSNSAGGESKEDKTKKVSKAKVTPPKTESVKTREDTAPKTNYLEYFAIKPSTSASTIDVSKDSKTQKVDSVNDPNETGYQSIETDNQSLETSEIMDITHTSGVESEMTGIHPSKKRKLEYSKADIEVCGRKVANTLIQDRATNANVLMSSTLQGLTSHCQSVINVTTVAMDHLKNELVELKDKYEKDTGKLKEELQAEVKVKEETRVALKEALDLIRRNRWTDSMKQRIDCLVKENDELKAELVSVKAGAKIPAQLGLGRGLVLQVKKSEEVLPKPGSSQESEILNVQGMSSEKKKTVMKALGALDPKNPKPTGRPGFNTCTLKEGFPLYFPGKFIWVNDADDEDTAEMNSALIADMKDKWESHYANKVYNE